MNYEEVLRIRDQLRRTWKPFFGSFGRLLPIQVKAIPIVLAERNAIIASPTASGKTEAVVAPIAEKLLEDGHQGLSVLYISPTRALVNDLYERLRDQMRDLDISLTVKTGDRPQFDPERPQEFLITTPESFDSLICRHPHIFAETRFVVLDELHLLDGTYRGDQLRLLLKRLRAVTAGRETRYYALSATFRNPKEVAARYFNPSEVVSVGGRREIMYELVDATDLVSGLRTTVSLFRKSGIHKALFFCNSRRETEEIARMLQREGIWPEDRVFVHHGSLAKVQREEAEEAMRIGKGVLCVATMSLEVGIDIGDIEATVLVHPPPSVSSLLQRIGRGNRRRGYVLAFGLHSTDEERRMLEVLFRMAREGILEDVEQGPCFSVAVQQAFSFLFQKRSTGVGKEELLTLLKGLPMNEDDVELTLFHLCERGYIELARGRYLPSTKLMNMAERGYVHSNIPDRQGYRVIDSSTGKEVGEVGLLDSLSENLVLGGRMWRIVRVEGVKVYVKPAEAKETVAPSFTRAPVHGAFYGLLPPTVRGRCCRLGDGEFGNEEIVKGFSS